MAWRERLYERRLKGPIDAEKMDEMRSLFHRRRHEIPIPAELIESPGRPEMTIRTKWLSFIVQFQKDIMNVDAELTLAAKMMATRENRRLAVQFIDSIADDLNL
ncbi:hypothetical protein OJF2_16640 [Aquisphaera giovannonii]|uniref:Uncharacterized protein n=1 Tax=Aquisphaera giovannonii TaxID=406548 RepID=A0A5B9VYU0_9BACT|nr:hypothetical protein [Aquisphaera giovannonii]QEH33167.1 hypothetical protein OJF2_16640 [Aquisphaera giovannonii]